MNNNNKQQKQQQQEVEPQRCRTRLQTKKIKPTTTATSFYRHKSKQQPSKSQQQQQTVYCTSQQQDNENIIKNNLISIKNKQWSEQNLQVSYKPDSIIGREKEKQLVSQFIDGCLMKEITNRCLCNNLLQGKDVSGCPGLGKTVTVMEMINQLAKEINSQKASFHYVNCLSLKQPSAIYKQLLLQSKKKLQSKRKQSYNFAIEFDTYLKSPKLKTLLFFVIDEVDFLYTKNQNVIYNLVEWCSLAECKFSVIMIANTMDFPEKLAPKVTSRMGSWRMCFKPYSSQEIKKIIQKRLQGSDYFEPRAIQFAVKKFSVYTSDLRKIFNILKQLIKQNISQNNNSKNNNKNKNKRVTIQQLSQVWNKLVQQEDISYKQELPAVYMNILDLIKKQGGKMHSYQLYGLLYQKGVRSHDVEMALGDMKEMGMVKLMQKDYKSVKGLLATLVHGNV